MHPEDGRSLTRRERFRFVGVLAMIAVVAAVVSTCTSCAAALVVPPPARTMRQMHHSTNTLRVLCPRGMFAGSGVMVSPTRMLTAGHVIRCEGEDGVYSKPLIIEVNPGDDKWRPATIVKENHTADVAMLQVEGLEMYFTPVTISDAPVMGTRVCTSTGKKPRYALKCGVVQPTSVAEKGSIQFDGIIEPGNSGSGLYDDSGHLVGVVVSYMMCVNGQICGGAGTALWPLRAELGLMP